MRYALPLTAILFFGLGSRICAQPVRIGEEFGKNAQYHVSCQVDISGVLTIPAGKDGKAKTLKIAGKSAIKYDERILQLFADRRVERTVRQYQELDFERKVGDEVQRSRLRPEVRRLVILRHNQYEVPFCPSGALTPGEIELVRTDVFTPALAGLFPAQPVAVGESWRADSVAIQELTDLDKIDKADLKCTFEKITTLLGRRNAQVKFEGKAQGFGEDGNALHEIVGSYYLDLDAGFLSYVYVKGTHHLLDKTGNATGKIEGVFVMTRTRQPESRELTDDALRGLTLEPNAENSLLLFDQPNIGARFLHPRNWRIAGLNDKQIGIDEARGNGILLTLTPAASTPSAIQFRQETQQWLAKQQAKILREDKIQSLPGGLEVFAFEAQIGKDRVLLQYYVTRQGSQGATLTARLLPGDANAQREVERIARSLQLRAVK
jgi:hypothetical protein